MVSDVRVLLEKRHRDVKNYIASKMRGADAEQIDDVFVATIEKALRLEHTFDATRASWWTWVCLLANGLVCEHYRKLARRTRTVTFISLTDLVQEDKDGIPRPYDPPSRSPEDDWIEAIDAVRVAEKLPRSGRRGDR